MITFSHQRIVPGSLSLLHELILGGHTLPAVPGYSIHLLDRIAGGEALLHIKERLMGRTVDYQIQSQQLSDELIVWRQRDPGRILIRTIHWYFHEQDDGVIVGYRFSGELIASPVVEPLMSRIIENTSRGHIEAMLSALATEMETIVGGEPAKRVAA